MPYRAAAASLLVLADRLEHLQRAKHAYHSAAHGIRVAANLQIVIRELTALRPGLRQLKAIVRHIDATQGYDPEELEWLNVHERSLNRHIAALRRLRAQGAKAAPLLEFGEFLRRPADITARVTWR